ncbi:hypothetical protein ACTMSW_22575 [Micromonospora sp. BQ11]|uniref:hypothetical protein n=1 Tax=Micromonospora sp. BQ11 TaxID=3452212 RepID=UPI003F8C679D
MATRSASGRASGSTATKDVPGNQTPNTPDINESEIRRLTVDQLRGRLRRRGVTGTADLRKDDLVDALIKALREGRKTTRSQNGSRSVTGGDASRSRRGSSASRDGSDSGGGSGSRGRDGGGPARAESPPVAALADLERRAAELEDVTPQAPEVEDVERRAAELETAVAGGTALPADPASDTPALPAAPADGPAQADSSGTARVPRARDAGGSDNQPVRTPPGPAGSGPALTLETADRVLTEMVPGEMDPVDEVVTPEGTVLTAGSGSPDVAVATPPLPGPASSPTR